MESSTIANQYFLPEDTPPIRVEDASMVERVKEKDINQDDISSSLKSPKFGYIMSVVGFSIIAVAAIVIYVVLKKKETSAT